MLWSLRRLIVYLLILLVRMKLIMQTEDWYPRLVSYPIEELSNLLSLSTTPLGMYGMKCWSMVSWILPVIIWSVWIY